MTENKQLTEVIEGNKLIAEFDGYYIQEDGLYFKNDADVEGKPRYCQAEDLKYHTSFDWLMPACQKWDELDGFMRGAQSEQYETLSDYLDNAVTRRYEIKDTWEQLVENLKWYNQNKQS